jgi:hypothetical protein
MIRKLAMAIIELARPHNLKNLNFKPARILARQSYHVKRGKPDFAAEIIAQPLAYI